MVLRALAEQPQPHLPFAGERHLIKGISIETALTLVQDILESHLTEVQEAVFRGVWHRQSYQEIIDTAAENGNYYSLGHLKNTGSELWQSLSHALNQRVTKTNLQDVLLRYQSQQSQQPQPTRQDWNNAPDVVAFYGRGQDVMQLQQWITQDRCRLISILGMGGIGKTSLTVKVAQSVASEFEFVIWRSLLNAPTLEELLGRWLQFLSQKASIELPKTLDGLLYQLQQTLQAHRCLLILDNVETILQGSRYTGEYRTGYENYGQLFEQIGKTAHQSCLLITSREKSKVMARLEGRTRPVRSYELKGLGIAEAQQIFAEFGDFRALNSVWQEIVQLYSGNPLGLEMVARHIQEVFQGDIQRFLQLGKPVFHDLLEVLDRHFNRLSEAEQEIVYWLAINREPTSLEELQQDIFDPIAQAQLSDTLQSLRRRWALEQSGDRFTSQPVLLEYVTQRLIMQVASELMNGQLYLFNRFALQKAQSTEPIRQAQSRLILKPLIDTLLIQWDGRKNVAYQLQQLLETLRVNSPLKPGYAAGNIVNLLREMKVELARLNCSHLNVWQAYLSGVNLLEADFSYSDLSKSIFTETFGTVTCLAFSPKGDRFAIGGEPGEIRIWRTQDEKPLQLLKGHTEWVFSIAFSPDGKTLLSGSDDSTAKLWDVETGNCIYTFSAHQNWVWSVAFSPTGKVLATASADSTIRLHDTATGLLLKVLQGHTQDVRSIAFSPDGQLLASAGSDCIVRLWDIETGDCIRQLTGHQDWIWTIAFSPNGILATGSKDKTIRVWDYSSPGASSCQVLKGHSQLVRTLAFSSDGRLLASGSDDQTVKLWDITTQKCFKTFVGHTDWVWSVVFAPQRDATSSPVLISGDGNKTVKVWNAKTGECHRTHQGAATVIHSIAFNAKGTKVCSGSSDGLIRLWQTENNRLLQTFQADQRVLSVAFSPDETILASSGKNLMLWNVHTGSLLHRLEDHQSLIPSICFSHTGDMLATGSFDATIKFWDVRTGRCLRTLIGHRNLIWSIALSKDNQLLASGGNDSTVKIWDVSTGVCLATLVGHVSPIHAVAFSPDGKWLASGGDDSLIRLWDVDRLQCLQTLAGHRCRVTSIAFSPDGQSLVTSSTDQTVKLWSLSESKCLSTLNGSVGRTHAATFQPYTLTVAAAQNETVKFWNLQTNQCNKVLKIPHIYEKMNILGVAGLTPVQRANLLSLGAIEL